MTGEVLPPLVEGVSGLLEPLANRRAGERVAERLTTAIALGQFWPGQRLPAERRLAELLSVSRSTVRDALAILGDQGLVQIRRGRSGGAFVVSSNVVGSEAVIRRALLPGWERLAQLLDFRCSVEQQVARLAAERRSDAEAAEIRRLAQAYLDSGTSREQSAVADRALHEAIARAAHNPLWSELSVQLRYEVNQGLGVEPFSAQLRRRGEEQHPVLAEAVADGDVEHAGALALAHFALTNDAIRELLAAVARSGASVEPRDASGRAARDGGEHVQSEKEA
ncbi:MAG: GntR family transcriptional regulator [Actinomycetota bacterium]|nr:GntR family transcriptional regulator [Actinomycetota bacterium]